MAGDLKTQLEVSVDGTGVEAGVSGINKSLDTIGKKATEVGKQASAGIDQVGSGAASTAPKVDAATKNMIGSIQRQIAVMEAGSKSGADYYRVLAGQRGIDTSALKPYLDQLEALTAKQKLAESALQMTSPILQKVGVSAAQTAAALRQLPAQFSDIAVSLQGGQSPLTVLLQQGSQIKDSFGGVGAAAKALGGYVLGLINPFTVAAAAAGAFAVALYQGSSESQGYAKALVLTGNVLGTTVGQLQNTATQISKTVGTQAAAAEALTALANSGKIAASSLTEVGTATVLMQRVLGTAADKATDLFEKLADEPAKASAKLNESMHYLNLTTFERIRALEEQGLKEAATAVAQSALANALTSRLQTVEAQAGSLERGWRTLADGANAAWNAMLGVGRTQSIGERLGQAQAKLQESQAQAGRSGAFAAFYAPAIAKQTQEVADLSRQALREQENAAAQGEKAKTDQAQIGASTRLKILTEEIKTNADKRKKAIAELNADYRTLGKEQSGAEYDQLVAKINDKFKDPKAEKAKAYQDDAATKFLQQQREIEASLRAQLEGVSKLSAAEQEQVKFAQLLADLKGKTALTADQRSLLAAQDRIKAQLAINVGLSREEELQQLVAKQEEKRAKAVLATANAADGVRRQIADDQRQQREQYDDRLGVIGLGSEAAEQLRSREQIERQYARTQRQFTEEAARNKTLETEVYVQGSKDIQDALKVALEANRNYYADVKRQQADWSLGAAAAIANYRDESANVFKQTEQLVGNAFKGMEDAIVRFATTGKLDFKSLADSIISDLVRIQARAAITSALGGGSGSGLGSLLGAISGGLSGSSAAGIANVVGGNDSLGTMLSLMNLVKSANGNVFKAPGLSAYSGQIVDKPTVFPFANGIGLMGEAGAEAIMPLRRGADGKLGVAGGGSRGDVIIQNFAGVDVQTKEEPNDSGGIDTVVILRQFEGALAKNVASGRGPLASAMESRFGLRTSTR
jgi:lambda family phage tail tape measure protein